MHSLTFSTMNQAYWGTYNYVQGNGKRFVHRGAPCIEVRPMCVEITMPEYSLFTGTLRRLNYRFWAAETLGYIAGWGTYNGKKYADLLVKLNSNYANFRSPHTEMLFPMVRYGDGFKEGLPRAYQTLSENPDRRQAYVPVWNHLTDHSYEESPCMTGCQFFTEEVDYGQALGKVRCLSMLAHMRSNDLGWGFPYDVASMCAILIAMAGALNMGVGRYHHMATSMHYYRDGSMGEGPPRVLSPDDEIHLRKPPVMPVAKMADIRSVQAAAGDILHAMYAHFVVNSDRGVDFNMKAHEDVEWVKQWCNVVRWGWPR